MSELEIAIEEQSLVLKEALSVPIAEAVAILEGSARIWLVGTGTSQHAAELGSQMLRLAGVDARWESAAGFARLRPAAPPGDAVILITHTGETAFAQTVRASAIADGRALVSITGTGVGWPEALEIARPERSETYTASYTAALFVLARIAGALGAEEFSGPALLATIESVTQAADHSWGAVAIPERLLVVTGTGPASVTAREGALKVREAARLPSEGFEAEYLLHGSAVPLGDQDGLILLQNHDPDGLVAGLGAAAEKEGVDVTILTDPADLEPLLLQIPLTIRLQRLALEFSHRRGYDPDAVIEGAWAGDHLWAAGSHGCG